MRHRFGLHFENEAPTDRASWQEWLGGLPAPVAAVAELGERRPLIAVAAPFPNKDQTETRRDDELAGLEIARSLVDSLSRLADRTGRSIRVLLSGRSIGSVAPGTGPDAEVTAMMAEWQALSEARPADEARWERPGWVTLWAGMVPAEEMKRLFEEFHGVAGPISRFARAIEIEFYERETLEWSQVTTPVALSAAVARLPRAATFADQLPAPQRDQLVNAVAVLFETDFTQRPRGAARRKLAFVGAFPYRRK